LESRLRSGTGDLVKGISRRAGALNGNVEKSVTKMQGEYNILGATAAMVEAERATEAIEVGNGSMTTALESTTGRIGRNNDDLESGSVEGGDEEFITINVTGWEESSATGIVGKFISNA
jgi:hypothetical protein